MNASLEMAKIDLRKAELSLAAAKSKVECLENFERLELERNRAKLRRPREGFVVFNPQGEPQMYTVRCRELSCIMRFTSEKGHAWEYFERQGYSVGPCVVKPIIRA